MKAATTTFLCLSLFGINQVSHAENMYVFKDKSGNVLLTNVVNGNKKPKGNQFSQFNKTVKVTWYKDTNVHNYSNWGKNEAAVLPSFSKNKNAFDELIVSAANRHGVDAALMKAIMHTESSFNPNARSPVGAQGLMQLMPATAKRFHVTNAWNPAQNIEGAAKYLKFLLNRFGSRTELILASYNAGEGNVAKYNGIPPFRETQDYVKRVLSRYHNLYKNDSRLSTVTATTNTPASSLINRSNSTSRNSLNNSDAAYEATVYAALTH